MDADLTPTMDRQIAGGTLPERVFKSSSAAEALNRGELDAQISYARRYPRSLALFKQRALTMIKLDADTAASCYYALPRRQRQEDGSFKRVTITGPSIRLAEIASTAWGNIRAAGFCVSETDEEVTARGWCIDLETNNAQIVEVSRRIVDRRGRRFPEDMVTSTRNAACAIARRNAIYAVIPRAFIKPLEEAAKKVASGDAKTLAEGRARAIAAFAEEGVSIQALLDKLERRGVEDIDLEDLGLLGGLLNAIKEKETTIEAEFKTTPAPETGSRSQALAETVRRRREATEQAAGRGPEPPTTHPFADPETSPEPPASSDEGPKSSSS